MSSRQVRKMKNSPKSRTIPTAVLLSAVAASGLGAAWATPPWNEHLEDVATAEPPIMDGRIYTDRLAIADDYISAASGRPATRQ